MSAATARTPRLAGDGVDAVRLRQNARPATDTTEMLLFETPRLRCRRLAPGDAQDLLAVYGDADAMRWVGDGRPITWDGCLRWIDVTAQNVATRGYGMCALLDRVDDAVIGFCGLVHPGGQPQAEIKYALRRTHWGRGIATEAVTGMLAWGLAAFGIGHVIATVAPGNTASLRVLAKAGLQPLELRRNDDGSTTQVLAWHAG